MTKYCTSYRLINDNRLDDVTLFPTTQDHIISDPIVKYDENLQSNFDYMNDNVVKLYGLSTALGLERMSKLDNNNEESSSLIHVRQRSVLWPRICFFTAVENDGLYLKKCFFYEPGK
ncbi:unnamed protein product [Didymodactylos carnosus]|uniref:Uncharacterized protein n=1 Tax=Didymodactylos carnosus TaxID=1234261 RepID=A0A813SL35_9BILA|nr:unnamed protein product [Didymodactylos carnosus]CAF3583380.1 unnamed protein product [Didymodactylos carnosus]